MNTVVTLAHIDGGFSVIFLTLFLTISKTLSMNALIIDCDKVTQDVLKQVAKKLGKKMAGPKKELCDRVNSP
jgi:hypothetical protein